MYPGYWDDYMDDGTGGKKKKDCTHLRYRLFFNSKFVGEGLHIRKQTLHSRHGYTKGQMKKFNNTERLKQLGYTVLSRRWNVTQNKWETEKFEIV
jgi:hypothetical protein